MTLVAMWFVMMAGMMAPAVYPWVQAFRRFEESKPNGVHAIFRSGIFVSGYLAVWLAYSIVAAGLQLVLINGGVTAVPDAPSLLSGLVLLVAGLFQFAHFKRACLQHCRNPFTYFLSRWRNGTSSFRIGFSHGLFCVGCCWAIMATGLAVGVMNIWWMAVLTLAVFLEQTVSRGDLARRSIGIALIIAGSASLLRANL